MKIKILFIITLTLILTFGIILSSYARDKYFNSNMVLYLKLGDKPKEYNAYFIDSDTKTAKAVRLELENTTSVPKDFFVEEDGFLATPVYYESLGDKLDNFYISYKVISASDNATLSPVIKDRYNRIMSSAPIKLDNKSAWQEASIKKADFTLPDNATLDFYRVTAPGIKITVPANSKVVLDVDTAKLNYTNKDEYFFLTDKPYLKMYTGKKVVNEKPAPLPTRDQLVMGGDYGGDTMLETLKMVKRYFPQYDVVYAPVWYFDMDNIDKIKKLRENGIFVQNQKAHNRAYEQFIASGGAYSASWDGFGDRSYEETIRTIRGSCQPTNQYIRDLMAMEVDVLATNTTQNNFKQVDWVFNWDGRWGYDDLSIKELRLVLNQKDGGLELKDGKIYFWDYFKAYHGMKLTPKDLKIKSWDEFVPSTDSEVSKTGDIVKQRALAIHLAFLHYEWLQASNMLGKKAAEYGGIHSYTHNPEDIANGGDYIFLSKLKYSDIPYVEYFGNPLITSSAHYNSKIYIDNAKKSKAQVGYILELGAGGHGQHYMDPLLTLFMNYDVASNGYQDYHNEWLGSISKETMTDPKQTYYFDRMCQWLGGAFGFDIARSYKNDHIPTDTYSISIRSSVDYMDSWIWSIYQMDSMTPYLRDVYVNCDQTDQVCYNDILKKARVIFYNPPKSKKELVTDLNKWLDKSGKILFTHSYIPFANDNGGIVGLVEDLNKPIKDGKVLEGVLGFFKDRNTDMVVYRGEPYSYADYQKPINNAQSGASELEGFEGKNFSLKIATGKISSSEFKDLNTNDIVKIDNYFDVNLGGTPVIFIGDKPLLTKLTVKGSDIYYLHARPSELPQDLVVKITSHLKDSLALPKYANSGADTKYYLHRYMAEDNIEQIMVWDRSSLSSYPYNCGGYVPGIDKLRILANDPKANIDVNVPVKNGDYTLYEASSGKETKITVTTGEINLKQTGKAAELFFIVPSGKEDKLAKVKETMARFNDALQAKFL